MGGADPIQFRRGVGDVPEQFRRGGGGGMRASLRAYRRRLEHDPLFFESRCGSRHCLAVLLIGKPVPTFPEALFFAVLLIGKPVPTFPEAL